MTSTTRRRVCSLTLGLSFRTRDTVPTLTPAVAATSAMFTRWADLSRLTPRLRWQAEQLLRMEPLPLHVLLVAAAVKQQGRFNWVTWACGSIWASWGSGGFRAGRPPCGQPW